MQIEQIDRDAAAKALGYATWEDATDYRNSGAEDRRVAHMVQAFAAHRLAALSARPAVGEDVVERVARAMGLHEYSDHTPPVRWPEHPADYLPNQEGAVPLTWDFANICRRRARAAIAAMNGEQNERN